MQRPDRPRYLIQSLVHASQVLSAFHTEGEVLRLRDIVARTGLTKMTCYRLVYTLHECGFVEKIADNQYRAKLVLPPKRKYVLGYTAPGQNTSFPRDVESSLLRAASDAHCEIIVLNNHYNGKTALRNADGLIREGVDLAVLFQVDQVVAPAIAARFLEAKIPLIAIDIPHPGATYFGANNYRAGTMAGQHLGMWANKYWDGAVDDIVMLGIGRAGNLPQARIRGMLDGINEVIREISRARIIHLDGDGTFGASQECTRRYLRASNAHHVLVGAANDPSAVGALRAFEEVGRSMNCAIVGHNADLEGRTELRTPGTRLIGSVAFFPERYGDAIIRLALDILAGKTTAPALFIKHQFVTRENVDQIYPNDRLVAMSRGSLGLSAVRADAAGCVTHSDTAAFNTILGENRPGPRRIAAIDSN